jgi:transposase
MAYRYGNREQMTFFPESIEEYIGKEDPVRAYDAFVEAIDINELGIHLVECKVGNSEYDPKAMLKLLVYGYSYGVRSSRKLERAVYHNISFIWLVGGLKPDHKTIANFRKNNKAALKKVLKLCAKMCMKLDLIEGNTLFVDGTKLKANAGKKNTWTPERCERALKKIDKRIEDILAECTEIDNQEQDASSLVKLSDDLKHEEALKEKVKGILADLNATERKSINTTDKECNRVKDKGKYYPGYNAQIVTDEKNGIIVSSDVVAENNDTGQFADQITQANNTLGEKCENAVGDAGYSNLEELKKVDSDEITVIVPSPRQASHKEASEFSKEKFSYNADQDYYRCPEGNILQRHGVNNEKKCINYDITKASICKNCKHYGTCTTSKKGRRITRLFDEELKEKLEKQYSLPESQAIYSQRKGKVELPFGHLKRNLAVDGFLVRGLEGVKAEFALLSSGFNISRMITLLGVSGLLKAITA